MWALETEKTSPAFFDLLFGGFLVAFLFSLAEPLLVFNFFASFSPLLLLKDNLLTTLALAAGPA